LPPRHLLGYQRTIGNQAVQRLLAQRQAVAAPSTTIQRLYVVQPYADLGNSFNGLQYAGLRQAIENYRNAARVGLVAQMTRRLNELTAAYQAVDVPPRMRPTFNDLSVEINAEIDRVRAAAEAGLRNIDQAVQAAPARVNVGQQPPVPAQVNIGQQPPVPAQVNIGQQPLPPAQVNIGQQPPPPAQVNIGQQPPPPAQVNIGQQPLPPAQVNVGQQAPQHAPANVQQAGPARQQAPAPQLPALRADPTLLPEHEAQRGIDYRIVAPNVNITNPRTHETASYNGPMQGVYRGLVTEVHFTVPGGAALNNGRSTVAAEGRAFEPHEVNQSPGGTRVLYGTQWYQLDDPGLLTRVPKEFVELTINGEVRRVENLDRNVTRAAVGFKRLQNDAPIFPRGPAVTDIQQTGLGDCYLQGLLISIVNNDAGHLQRMMTDNADGTITVRFYTVDERNPAAPAYAAEDIRINKSVPENAAGNALYQAGATWARLMQKAFAVFAQMHGQYGVAYQQPARGQARPGGYAGIASGVTHRLYGVFYGPARQASGSESTSFDASVSDRENVRNSAGAIRKLLEFNTVNAAQGGDRLLLGAAATSRHHVTRALATMSRIDATDLQMDQNVRAAWNRLQQNLAYVQQEFQNPRNANVEPANVDGMALVIRDADRLATGLIGLARANTNHRDFSTMFELVNNLKEAGRDTSPGQRNIYAEHAYAITRAVFHPAAPDPQHLTPDVLDGINMNASTVTLRNPHGKNSPNLYNEARNNDDGEFSMSLIQFLRNFSEVEYGRVRRV
jgi:hypothetical protein